MPPPASASLVLRGDRPFGPGPAGLCSRGCPVSVRHTEHSREQPRRKDGGARRLSECTPPPPTRVQALCVAGCVGCLYVARTSVAPHRACGRSAATTGRAHTPSGGPSRRGAAPRGCAAHPFPLRAGPHVAPVTARCNHRSSPVPPGTAVRVVVLFVAAFRCAVDSTAAVAAPLWARGTL